MDFDAAFPRLAYHLTRCGGQLAVKCGAHSYDDSASITFHSLAASVFTLPAVAIRVIGEFILDSVLCDIEACIAWIESEAGPCELYLCDKESEFFESNRIELCSSSILGT